MHASAHEARVSRSRHRAAEWRVGTSAARPARAAVRRLVRRRTAARAEAVRRGGRAREAGREQQAEGRRVGGRAREPGDGARARQSRDRELHVARALLRRGLRRVPAGRRGGVRGAPLVAPALDVAAARALVAEPRAERPPDGVLRAHGHAQGRQAQDDQHHQGR